MVDLTPVATGMGHGIAAGTTGREILVAVVREICAFDQGYAGCSAAGRRRGAQDQQQTLTRKR
jgi:hypothetical protein